LPIILEARDIFIHDGASIHTARIMKKLLDEIGIIMIIWPLYSPDLNPIKNLWAIMKQEIYKLYPELEHANDTEETLDKLIAAAKEAWQAIDRRILYNLSITMPHRVAVVIAANGWYTKY
jgi:transposase